MGTLTIEELYEQHIKPRTPEERARLVAMTTRDLVDSGSAENMNQGSRPKWSDIRGTAPYPMLGEDAQEWVTRTRRESEEGREIPR